MSKKIFKYQLETTDVQRIEMPQGAKILTIQMQNRVPCLCALVEPNATVTKRTFEIFGTGHNVPDNVLREYVGTYQLKNSQLVFHCFEMLGLS